MLRLEHFSEPSFVELAREIFPHFDRAFKDFPEGHEIAKVWEITNTVRAFRDLGVLRSDAEILGVAAGFEHTVFWLTNHVRRVFATDLYEATSIWREAEASMLIAPDKLVVEGFEWQPRRLVVQHMNALDLRYDDNSFEGVFSCGSIEHFGSLDNVAASLREIARVLKPGGIAALATEFRISGPQESLGIPGAIIFTPSMLLSSVVHASGLDLVDEPEWTTSQATIDVAYPLSEAVQNGIRARSVALTESEFMWTSGMIVLRKSG